MSKTGRLGLPYILQAQAQKEVTHNQALNMLDVYINTVAEAMVDELPVDAKEGSIYIVNNKLAQYMSGSWTYYPALEYMEVWLRINQTKMIFNGEKWLNLITLPQARTQEDNKNGK